MRNSTWAPLLVVSFCWLSVVAQQSAAPSSTSAGATHKTSASKARKPDPPRLTEQQRQGLRRLKAAKAMADGLQPDMRAYVLWQVSHGYRKVAPRKSIQALQEAFTASRAIEDSGPRKSAEEACVEQVCAIQRWLQREILSEMLDTEQGEWHPEQVENLLPQSNPTVK